jgi:hypothetical protein
MQQTLACSDQGRLRAELMQCGFQDVTFHEASDLFPIPLSMEMTKTWFTMPMIKSEFENYTVKFLYAKWLEMLHQPNSPYNVDWNQNTLYVEYSAIVAVAIK